MVSSIRTLTLGCATRQNPFGFTLSLKPFIKTLSKNCIITLSICVGPTMVGLLRSQKGNIYTSKVYSITLSLPTRIGPLRRQKGRKYNTVNITTPLSANPGKTGVSQTEESEIG